MLTCTMELASYNASQFARASNTVVVTVNYRLGVFGFAALAGLVEQQGTSGNYGLLDQQQALKFVKEVRRVWVHGDRRWHFTSYVQVIHAFGGDPARVTLWGQGAGGASALLHMSFQGSAGLFSQVISESGAWDALSGAVLATVYTPHNSMAGQGPSMRACRRSSLHAMPRRSWLYRLGARCLPNSTPWRACVAQTGIALCVRRGGRSCAQGGCPCLMGTTFPRPPTPVSSLGPLPTPCDRYCSGPTAMMPLPFCIGCSGYVMWCLALSKHVPTVRWQGIRNGVSKPVAMMLLHQWFAGNATVVNAVWQRFVATATLRCTQQHCLTCCSALQVWSNVLGGQLHTEFRGVVPNCVGRGISLPCIHDGAVIGPCDHPDVCLQVHPPPVVHASSIYGLAFYGAAIRVQQAVLCGLLVRAG